MIDSCATSLRDHWEAYSDWVKSLSGRLEIARAVAVMPEPFGSGLGEHRPSWLTNLECTLEHVRTQFMKQKDTARARELALQSELVVSRESAESLRDNLTAKERSLSAANTELCITRKKLQVANAAAFKQRRGRLIFEYKLRSTRQKLSQVRAELRRVRRAKADSEAVALAAQKSEHHLMCFVVSSRQQIHSVRHILNAVINGRTDRSVRNSAGALLRHLPRDLPTGS